MITASLKKEIEAIVEAKASRFRKNLAQITREVQIEPREWEAFEGRITRRRSPTAPMPLVESYRDNIDSGWALENTFVDGEDITIDVDYGASIYEDKPIFEEVLAITDLATLWYEV